MRYSLFVLSIALSGCSMCSSEEEEAPDLASEPQTHPIAASERTILTNQLGYLRTDQRARASQLSEVAARPAIAGDVGKQRMARDMSKRQLQIALTAERTDRYIRAGDPKAAAYQRELGRLLVEQHRAIRAMLAALEAAALAEEVALWTELEAEYARSVVAYETFDDSWDYSVRDAPEDFFVEVDVMEELDRVPEHEVHYTFVHYFEEDDYAYYAEECDVELPEADALEAYADIGFEEIEVEEVEYADLSFELLAVEELEEQYELEPPEYYEEFVEDEPDFAEIEASFEEQDDQMEAIFETEPEELAEEHGEFFEAEGEAEVDVQVDVIDDATGEVEAEDVGEVVDEPEGESVEVEGTVEATLDEAL